MVDFVKELFSEERVLVKGGSRQGFLPKALDSVKNYASTCLERSLNSLNYESAQKSAPSKTYSKGLTYATAALALILSGCGGSGGGNPPPPPPPPQNMAPTISGVTTNPTSGNQPLNVQGVVGTVADDNLPAGRTLSCNYTWGDGSPVEVATPCATGTIRNHTYNGSSIVHTLSVTVGDGQLTSAPATATVSHNAAIPNLNLTGKILDAENVGSGGNGCTSPFQGLNITVDHNGQTYNAMTNPTCDISVNVPGNQRNGTNYLIHISVNVVIHGRDHPFIVPITNTTFTKNLASFEKYTESIAVCGIDAGNELRILPYILHMAKLPRTLANGQLDWGMVTWDEWNIPAPPGTPTEIPMRVFADNPPGILVT